MNIGESTIYQGNNPTIGAAHIEVSSGLTTETAELIYLQQIAKHLIIIEAKLDAIQTRLDESLWERIKRWLGIR